MGVSVTFLGVGHYHYTLWPTDAQYLDQGHLRSTSLKKVARNSKQDII